MIENLVQLTIAIIKNVNPVFIALFIVLIIIGRFMSKYESKNRHNRYNRYSRYKYFRKKDYNKQDYTFKNNRKKDYNEQDFDLYESPVMSETELAFYKVLKKIISNGYNISCKCRLEDIMKANIYMPKHKYNSLRGSIRCRHVDFIIFNENDAKVWFAIELDDSSHNDYKRLQDDEKKDKLFSSAGLKLIRIRVQTNYDEFSLKKTINNALQN